MSVQEHTVSITVIEHLHRVGDHIYRDRDHLHPEGDHLNRDRDNFHREGIICMAVGII